MEHCSIQLRDSSATYSPGGLIEGKFVVENQESISVRSINILFLGETKVQFSGYDSKFIHFEKTEQLWEGKEEKKTAYLPPGTHIFLFFFQIPLDSPPSFEGEHGSIRYKIHIELVKPDKKLDIEQDFYVLPFVVLNCIPQVIAPTENLNSIFYRRFLEENRELRMNVSVPKIGFTPGEAIPITLSTKNWTDLTITSISMRLIQNVCFRATDKKKNVENEIVEFRKYVDIHNKSDRQNLKLVIPQKTIPSFESELIQVDYKVQVEVEASEKHWKGSRKLELPIVVGTVPIQPGPPSYEEVADSVQEPPPPRYEE